MMESDPWPTELKVDKDRGVLAVTFDDGVSFALPAELLRVMSPSAEVQGHSPEERVTVPGKKAVRIRVVDATTGLPGIGTARGVGRYFARWLSQIVLYLGYFWMLWDPKKQCWHDKLARTLVVKAR